MFKFKEREVPLPITEEGLDRFVQDVTEKFGLPPGDDTYDAIATMIMHLDHRIAYVKPSYFGHGVLKSMANAAAYGKLRQLAQKRADKEQAEKAAQEQKPAQESAETPKEKSVTDDAQCGEKSLPQS